MQYLIKAFCWLAFLNAPLYAQVPQSIIVEHFTNTVCSICASRNPSFYANLANHPAVLHLAVHPSSPYASCQFNQHNPAENDARTNYYGIYGGTPRLVIQGNSLSTSSDYGNAALFAPYQSQTSPLSLRPTLHLINNDSVRVSTTVKIEAIHNLGDVRLFVALAEDTIFYAAPNGEDQHYGVFRRALSDPQGLPLALPSMVGDSAIYTATVPIHSAWNLPRLRAIAILQHADTRQVIQAAQNTPNDNATNLPNAPSTQLPINLSPNPASTHLTFVLPDQTPPTVAKLYSANGKLCATYTLDQNTTVALPALDNGIYWVNMENKNGILSKKIAIMQ